MQTFYEHLFTQHLRTITSYIKQTSTIATTEFLSKISNRKKIFNEHFNLFEAEISSDEFIKPIMMALQQSFINTFELNKLMSF